MQRRSTQGRGGPPQPGPPHPGPPPQPGPPQPRPPCQPPPCQPPPPPCQPANCAWWTTPEAAGGVGAAFATPARPMAEKPSAPAIAPAPTILFRIMAIPSLICNSWLETCPVGTYSTIDSVSMNWLCPGSASRMQRWQRGDWAFRTLRFGVARARRITLSGRPPGRWPHPPRALSQRTWESRISRRGCRPSRVVSHSNFAMNCTPKSPNWAGGCWTCRVAKSRIALRTVARR
jgi:hypothetical protein